MGDWQCVGFSTETLLVMTVHCFTLSRSRQATKKEQTKLYSRVSTRNRTNVIRKTDSVTKGN